MKQFAIVSFEEGFIAGELIPMLEVSAEFGSYEFKYQVNLEDPAMILTEEVKTKDIVATFEDLQTAQGHCELAKTLERFMRPMWLKAIEHAAKQRETMLLAVWACARGEIP